MFVPQWKLFVLVICGLHVLSVNMLEFAILVGKMTEKLVELV